MKKFIFLLLLIVNLHGSEEKLILNDLKTHEKFDFEELLSIEINDENDHNISWSPDENKLAIKSNDNKIITIWDILTNKKINELCYDLDSLKKKSNLSSSEISAEHEPKISFLSWGPNGQEVIFYFSENLIIWNINNKHKIRAIEFPKVDKLEISPDFKKLLAVQNNKILIFDTATGDEIQQFENDELISHAMWLADSSRVLFSGFLSDYIKIFDVKRNKYSTFIEIDDSILVLSICPKCKFFALGLSNNEVQIWDSLTAVCLCSFKLKGYAISLDWSPEHDLLAISQFNKKIKILDIKNSAFINLNSENLWFSLIKWSPKGNLLAGLSGSKIKIWKLISFDRLRMNGGGND